MQSNTLTAPRPLMHDVMPPYAKALPKQEPLPAPAPIVASPAPIVAADIPVKQPDEPMANPISAPVPAPAQPNQTAPIAPAPAAPAEHNHLMHQVMPPIRRPGISWAAVVLAVVVAAALGVAAFVAFRATNSLN